MPTGGGYASKGAARIYARFASTVLYPYQESGGGVVEPGIDIATLGLWHQIPLMSESVSPDRSFLLEQTLGGKAGYSSQRLGKIMGGGQLTLEGKYIGLDSIFAAALGIERFRLTVSNIKESPNWAALIGNVDGSALTTAAGTTGTALNITSAILTQAMVGSHVRIVDLTGAANTLDQVRRIVTVTTSTTATITPAWTAGGGANPGAGMPCQIGTMWEHIFDCSTRMHVERYRDIVFDAWLSSGDEYMSRWLNIAINKQVGVWRFVCAMIESVTLRLNNERLTVAVDVVPFDVFTSGGGTPANWYFVQSGHPHQILEQIVFSDVMFWLAPYSTSQAVQNADKLGISEFELTLKNNLQADLVASSSPTHRLAPARHGFRDVTGSFIVPRYESNARLTNFTAKDELMAILQFKGTEVVPGAANGFNRLAAYLRRLNLIKPDVPTSGPQLLSEKYQFRSLCPALVENPAGFPTIFGENGEIQIATVNQNPYNAFMGQQQE